MRTTGAEYGTRGSDAKLGSIRKFLLAAVLVLTAAGALRALDPSKTLTQYAHRIWDQQEGLLQPTVYAILQTRDGFLWLGTQDSLIRFNGVRFREVASADGEALHRALVRSLLEDRQGNLWAGTIGSGLVRIAHGSVITHYTSANGFPGANAFCLVAGSGDDIWICAADGLARMHDGRFHLFGTADGLPAGAARGTCELPDGTRWVATDTGLARSVAGGRFSVLTHASLPYLSQVNALSCDEDGTVWVGTDAGLVRVRDSDIRTLTTRDGIPDNGVLTLEHDRDHALWIGTEEGISRLRKGVLSVYRTRDGLSHSVVLSLFEDREGTLWAGTKNGLDQFTDGAVTPYTTHEGLSSDNAGPLVEDHSGRLWIGTLGGGLNVYDHGKFRAITARDGLLDNNILSLTADASGDVWAGTTRGISRLRNDRVVASYTRRNGLSGDRVQALLRDADGALWVGTEAGLDRWTGSRFVPARLFDVAHAGGVVGLFAGVQVKLFIATQNDGIFVVRDGKVTRPQTEVSRAGDCLFLDREQHAAWVGTLGSGLLRWKGNTLRHLRVKDGLFDNRIYGILRDDGRNFWLASSKGIFRVSQQDLDDVADGRKQFVNSFPFTTGQIRFECQSNVQPAAVRTHDGRLWFSTTNGVVMVNPRDATTNQVAPLVDLEAVLVNGKPVSTRGSGAALRLMPWERNVEIRYAGLSFLAPENVTFRYRMEGFEKRWTDAGNRREAFYTNLPPGRFDFRVMSRNADGQWSRSAAALTFTIEPSLYERRWFFPALALLLGVIGFAAYRLRIQQLQRTFQLVISERSRIARELHDTLLQGLSGVTMQLQALWVKLPPSKEKGWLADIIQDASRTSTEARQSLWGLRHQEKTQPEFYQRLDRAVRQATEGKRLDVELRLQPVSLNRHPELEFQLLRIASEAVANTVAHARAHRLTVALETADGLLRLSVLDDGTGFVPGTETRFGHFGLIGIRERAAEIGAKLTIDSAPGMGTAVVLTVPFQTSDGATTHRPANESNAPAATTHHNE